MINRIKFRDRFIIFFISAMCFAWFYANVYQKVWEGKSIILDDARTKNIVTLRKDFDRGEAKKIRMYVFGKIDGNARIVLSSQTQEPQEYKLAPGNVRLKIDREWTDAKCVLEYIPENVESGFLTLRYRFDTRRK